MIQLIKLVTIINKNQNNVIITFNRNYKINNNYNYYLNNNNYNYNNNNNNHLINNNNNNHLINIYILICRFRKMVNIMKIQLIIMKLFYRHLM